ncbi:hypothetical protein F4680DRAFT_286104 [Xylaria scruposa]|nr:hypothetical protein F4680DRAFT_286104 [Xylaria scruposa]
MRLSVAIFELLACSVGVSTTGTIALRQNQGTNIPSSNSVITVENIIPTTLASRPAIPRANVSQFRFETNGPRINKVRLKIYVDPNNGEGDVVISSTSFNSSVSTSGTNGQVMLNSDQGESTPGPPPRASLLSPMPDNNLLIFWASSDSGIVNKPLYVECEWTNSSASGNSTSQLFVVYNEDDNDPETRALGSLDGLRDGSNYGVPARNESTIVIPTSPTPTTKPEVSTSPASGTTAATAGPESATTAPNGLNTNAIIGIAVGVGGGGLLIAAALIWFFCFRRRRRTAAHHAMPSYASDVGVHAMMHDKEIPVVLESSSAPYGGAGGDNEGRPSTDHYAPYSDRSTTSPTPDHHRTASSTTAVANIDSTRGAPSPTPAIVSRYAHLVEEGMTEDEIRRLEEEERQLDAAIENAGRRGNS